MNRRDFVTSLFAFLASLPFLGCLKSSEESWESGILYERKLNAEKVYQIQEWYNREGKLIQINAVHPKDQEMAKILEGLINSDHEYRIISNPFLTPTPLRKYTMR